MLLVIDIGNTNLTFGLFDGEEICHKFRLTTSLPRTSDEFGVQIMEQLSHQRGMAEEVEDVIICSVVPKIMYSLTSGIKKYLKCDPMVVGQGTRSGIRIATTNPMEIGADRVVDAVGAYFLYGGPVIVIDYGTATTYDLVTADGALVAGVTVMLEGWGGWDGRYIVKQAKHTVDSSGGYTTQIAVRRVLEGY